MDDYAEYIDLLKRSLAGETETVRLYLACMAVAPPEHIPRLLEIQADETDHQASIADLLLESVAGQSADQEELVGAPAGAQQSGSGGERRSKGAGVAFADRQKRSQADFATTRAAARTC